MSDETYVTGKCQQKGRECAMANEGVKERNIETAPRAAFALFLRNGIKKATLRRGLSVGSSIAEIDPTSEAFIMRESLISFLVGIASFFVRKIAVNRSVAESFFRLLLMRCVT